MINSLLLFQTLLLFVIVQLLLFYYFWLIKVILIRINTIYFNLVHEGGIGPQCTPSSYVLGEVTSFQIYLIFLL